jgi:peptide/nickel transport system permease protein
MTEAQKSTELAAEEQLPEGPVRTPLEEGWRALRRNKLAMAGLVFLVLFALTAVGGLIVTSGRHPISDPSRVRLADKLRAPLSAYNREVVTPEDAPPFGIYLLGTDSLGRDVFSRMLQGAWVSLTIGFVAVGISVTLGILIGGIAGYFGKAVDVCVVMLIDVLLCIPRFFLILTVLALRGGSIFNIMLVVGVFGWMGTARFIRAEFFALRDQDFVTAARALGVEDLRIIFRHMVPNAMAPVLVSATLGIAGTILMEAGLSFLGFGVPPPHATWGKILADGKNYLFDAPWLTFVPGLTILAVVLAFNLFGEGLRDAINPKLRGRGT